MIVKCTFQWICVVLAVLCGLLFISRDDTKHRPHDLSGFILSIVIALIVQIFWK